MMNEKREKRMVHRILFLVVVSVVISLFFYVFLKAMADSLVYNYCEMKQVVLNDIQQFIVDSLVDNGSVIVGVLIFVFLFLLLIGRFLSEAIYQIREKEKEIMAEREILIRSLSHDIRTPLTAICSYTEYLREKEEISHEEMRAYMEMMERKAEQMKDLTDRLLESSKRTPEMIEHGRLLMEQLVMEWEEVLEDAFTCKVDMEKCPDFQGEIDVAEFRRIFDNLASNIQKYADQSVSVELVISVLEGRLVICQKNKIKENHNGISESHGIGILSIKSIAANYGGQVKIHKSETEYEIVISLLKIEK